MQGKKIIIITVLFLALAIPATLTLLKQQTGFNSRAAAPDQLEAEGGILSSTGATKYTDSQASGGQFVSLQTSITNPSPTPPSSITYIPYYIPTSIDKTGTTDVSTALNNWIQTIPNGTSTTQHSKIVFPAGAIYRMSQGIRLTGSHKTLDGQGTRIFTPPNTAGTGVALTILNSSNILVGMNWPGTGSTQTNDIVIHDFFLEGDHPNPGIYDLQGGEGQANIFVGLVNGLNIYNITASKSRGDYIDFSGYGNSNGHVYNFTGVNCGRNALSFLNTTDILIENSSWGICAYYWADFEPDDSLSPGRVAERITLRNNTFERWDPSPETLVNPPVGGGWISLSSSKTFTSTKDIRIEGNKLTGSHHATMQVYINQNSSIRLQNISFINNSAIQWLPRTGSDNQRNFVFQAKNIDGFVVTGNKQPGAGQTNGGYWFDPSLGSTTQPYNTTGFVYTNNIGN
jgi:hypothetical protein